MTGRTSHYKDACNIEERRHHDHRAGAVPIAGGDFAAGGYAALRRSAPKYQSLPGLIRKYYIRSEDGRVAGGIYLWESRQAAERVYDGEWRSRVEKLYGAAPTITWFDSPVVVDNAIGGTITKAA